jgi:hypothetical protein
MDRAMMPTPGATALHAQGQAVWDIAPAVAAYLKAHLKPGLRTLETGAGRSTLLFAEAGTHHVVVTPSRDERERIIAEAMRLGLSTEQLCFEVGYSQQVLPGLSGPLDFALIDGGHGFPIPAVDWTYIAPRLVVGGTLLIDDVDLWTGAMLVDFLKAEPGWAYEGLLNGRTAVFRVTAPCELREWTDQPYVAARSRWPQRWRKARNVMRHLVRGEFSVLSGKLLRDFGAP